MPTTLNLEEIVEQAMDLSPSEKAELIESLARTLESENHDAAWALESERRILAVDSGNLETIPAAEALRRGRDAISR